MKLVFNTYGSGRPNLLILHGLLGAAKNWHTTAKALAQTCTVYVPDLRNHGRSPHGTHTVDTMTSDIVQFIQDETLGQPVIVGHSMGGLVAMKLAAHFPNRLSALIVVDIAPRTDLKGLDSILDAMVSVDLQVVQRREDADRQLGRFVASRLTRQFLLQNLRRNEDGSFEWSCNLTELHAFVNRENGFRLDDTERYSGPTLFVGGGQSPHNLPTKKALIKHHFPNAELSMIEKAGHWLHFEAADEFRNIVRDFLRGIAATEATAGLD